MASPYSRLLVLWPSIGQHGAQLCQSSNYTAYVVWAILLGICSAIHSSPVCHDQLIVIESEVVKTACAASRLDYCAVLCYISLALHQARHILQLFVLLDLLDH